LMPKMVNTACKRCAKAAAKPTSPSSNAFNLCSHFKE
jgi:hypothetical protein